MRYQALYRQWRPKNFADVIGQENVIRTLRNQIINDRVAHAYLFSGIRGTGKTSVAKIFARAVNCLSPVDGDACCECELCKKGLADTNPDIVEVDAASNNGVDQIRDIIDTISFAPSVSRYKVYIIDEVHMLSKAAFNALLKTLEEPPAHAVFILATTDPQKVISTVLSRCQKFDFKRMTEKQLTDRLKLILKGEDRTADDAALSVIASAAEGGMRDAITLLDTCLGYTDGNLTAETVRSVIGSSGMDFVFAVTDAMFAFDTSTALVETDTAVRSGMDAAALMSDITKHLRSLLVLQMTGNRAKDLLELPADMLSRMQEQLKALSPKTLSYILDRFSQGEGDMHWASNPRNILELTIVRACTPKEEDAPEALYARIDELEQKVSAGKAASALEKRLAELEQKLESGAFTAAKPKAAAQSAAKPEAAKPAAPAEPAGPDADMLQKAIAAVCADKPSMQNYSSALRFNRMEGDMMIASLPAGDVIRVRLLNDRKDLFAAALTELYGREMRFAIEADEPARPGGVSMKVRKELDHVFTVFGRENVDVTD